MMMTKNKWNYKFILLLTLLSINIFTSYSQPDVWGNRFTMGPNFMNFPTEKIFSYKYNGKDVHIQWWYVNDTKSSPKGQSFIYLESPTKKDIKNARKRVAEQIRLSIPDSLFIRCNLIFDESSSQSYGMNGNLPKYIHLKDGKGRVKFKTVVISEQFPIEPGKELYMTGSINIDWKHPEKSKVKAKMRVREKKN
ncbi:MAG: hypothetical protein J6L60_04970 [Bacteroidaceae bacterium]|nr:hypothetical protein [Bacteroidaceae bacterium]